MKKRFYVAPVLQRTMPPNSWSSLLNDLIDIAQGEGFTEFHNISRRISLCCVRALDTTHATIGADTRVISIGEPIEEGNLTGYMDSLLGNLTGVATLKNKLEAIGISTSWLSGSNTIRDGIRYLLRVFAVDQIADGKHATDINDIIKRNLTVTVGEVPLAVRNGVRNWMQSKGLAIGWINNATTVREILHFIVENLGFGKFKMHGEDF